MANPVAPCQLQPAIAAALREWRQPDAASPSPLADLRAVHAIQNSEGEGSDQAVKTLLRRALTQLEREQPDLASLLNMHYLEGLVTREIASKQHWSQATANRWLAKAVKQLSDLVAQEEKRARDAYDQQLSARIGPASYTKLFGIDALLAQILGLLREDSPARMILLAGVGGIGKTSLADALARRCAQETLFVDIGWVTAKQHALSVDGIVLELGRPALSADEFLQALGEQLLAPEVFSANRFLSSRLQALLRERLAGRPHLIVIDNLETMADLDELLPLLRQLIGRSKFLLTSRQTLPAAPDVAIFRIPELAEADALELVRHEARSRNLEFAACAADSDLRPIYQAVGGNPLALRLVIGQLPVHGLSTVLQKLLEAQGQPIENLYEFIYAQAWDSLDPVAQTVLLAMPLTPPAGGSLAQIAAVSGLAEDQVYDALLSLISTSLVDRKGGLQESTYAIHALTRSFLHKGVLRWQGT